MTAHATSTTLTPLAALQQESMDVEVVLDHPIGDDCHDQYVYLWIQSLHSSDGSAAPSFRDELGPAPPPTTVDAAAAPPPPPASSPASPDPYGDEGSISYDDDSLPSTIAYLSPSRYEDEPPWWMDSGMSEADDDDDGRLVIDESPMSPVPASLETDQDDTDEEEERSYYLQYYQRSLEDYRTILLPSQP